MENSLDIIGTAGWIWPNGANVEPNQYVEFRHVFELDMLPETALLQVSADKDYIMWINGKFVDCGQFSNWPDRKTYDILDVARYLCCGRNVLAILAYWQGASSSTYKKGDPGLIYALTAGDQRIFSGEDSVCRRSSSYFNGALEKITGQLGFSFRYDARGNDCWISPEYTCGSDWSAPSVKPCSARNVVGPRPVKKLKIGERLPAKIIAQGVFRRDSADNLTIAQQMKTDFLSTMHPLHVFGESFNCTLPSERGVTIKPELFSSDGGVYVIIDLDREESGFLELDLEAGAGTIIDIGYGEHLDDLRVRTYIGQRNFACRYICRDGRQTFTHRFIRFAGRYIQLHISGARNQTTIYYAGLRPTEYPLEMRGSFESPDGMQKRIYDTSVKTLHLCMHDHYEDCPWREQALYAMDSRNQALCGYYCFGDYEFPAASFALLGDGIGADAHLELCAPGDVRITIPTFCMAWIIELGDFYMYSADIEFIRGQISRICTMLDAYTEQMVNGLVQNPVGERYWHFYDWAPGLDGYHLNAEFAAPHNLFLILALDAGARLADACGLAKEAQKYRNIADDIRAAFDDAFWDARQCAYRTFAGQGSVEHYCELVQSLAICAGVCGADVSDLLRKRLTSENSGLVETTLSMSIYKFEALLEDHKVYGKWVFDKIARDWGYMLSKGATSFWETIVGADDFDFAGSLCHGWSGVPVYFYSAYLLGVKPVEPGFAKFSILPVQGVVDRASGSVPTPYGTIDVEWKNVDGDVDISLAYPEDIAVVDDIREREFDLTKR